MRPVVRLVAVAAVWCVAVAGALTIAPTSERVLAESRQQIAAPPMSRPVEAVNPSLANSDRGSGMCTCPGTTPGSRIPDKEKIWPKPKIADLRPMLDASDQIAALEAIQLALMEVGDGSTYVWHSKGGKLTGTVKPVSSFRNAEGRICRHIETSLTAGVYSKNASGTACRDSDGIWSLEG